MCGVAGVLNLAPAPPPSVEELGWMIAAQKHRGPDGVGVFVDADIGLSHPRIAIIDPASGAQPFLGEEGRVIASYNGEIYNHEELRVELSRLGYQFRTRCDTEVLVVSYEAWGEACVERFEGQFAFALWDANTRRLLLARDRFGVRPLHYARAGRRLAFASEIKALFQLPDIPRAIDPHGLDEVFTFWAPLAPRTAWRGISEIRPGHVATIAPGGELEERAYFDPTFPPAAPKHLPQPIEASEEALCRTLTRATELRLRADVPVGCYLSGGLDSSVIAALARRLHGGKFSTFSIRFEDQDLDEGRFQREMARR